MGLGLGGSMGDGKVDAVEHDHGQQERCEEADEKERLDKHGHLAERVVNSELLHVVLGQGGLAQVNNRAAGRVEVRDADLENE